MVLLWVSDILSELITVKTIYPLVAAGSDYESKSNFRIRWLSGTVNPRYVPTPTAQDPAFEFRIIDDEIPEEPKEYFEIVLTLNPTGNGKNGFFFPDAVGRVTILDDDIRKFMTAAKE